MPIHFILLPPESTRGPLTLALAFAYADSVDELRFWNKSESWIAQLFIQSILLLLESKQCPLTLVPVLACCGFRWQAPILKQEWISIYPTTTTFLGKEKWRYIDQISPRLLPWYLEFILNSEIRIKYAETVLFVCNIQRIPIFAWIGKSLFDHFLINSFTSQTYKRRVPELQADHPTQPTVSFSWKIL